MSRLSAGRRIAQHRARFARAQTWRQCRSEQTISLQPSSPLLAAARELGRIEQPRQSLARHVRHFARDFANRRAFRVRLLRDGRAPCRSRSPDSSAVTRSGCDRARARLATALTLESGDGAAASARAALASSSMLCSRLYAITGNITFNWKLPDWPAMATVASLPMTCARRHRDSLRNHRIDLARHDAAARLQRRQRDLGEAGERAAIHPAQVVGDLHQATASAGAARQLDRGVLRRQRREAVRARRSKASPCMRGSAARGALPNSGWALMPVPTAVPPCAQRVQPRLHGSRGAPWRPRPAFASRTSPGRASPASRPSGACGRSSRSSPTSSPSPQRSRSSSSAGSNDRRHAAPRSRGSPSGSRHCCSGRS